MSYLCTAAVFVIWGIVQIVKGDYGFAIADFLFVAVNILGYLIESNKETKKAFEKFEEIFFEIYGKHEKK